MARTWLHQAGAQAKCRIETNGFLKKLCSTGMYLHCSRISGQTARSCFEAESQRSFDLPWKKSSKALQSFCPANLTSESSQEEATMLLGLRRVLDLVVQGRCCSATFPVIVIVRQYLTKETNVQDFVRMQNAEIVTKFYQSMRREIETKWNKQVSEWCHDDRLWYIVLCQLPV